MYQQDDSRSGRRYLPDPQVCRRYGVSSMTLWRWDHDPRVNFPKPIRINRRKYRDEAELEAWERRELRRSDVSHACAAVLIKLTKSRAPAIGLAFNERMLRRGRADHRGLD